VVGFFALKQVVSPFILEKQYNYNGRYTDISGGIENN
jgi:hypothetical protein